MTLVETRLRKALDEANKEIEALRKEVERLSADILSPMRYSSEPPRNRSRLVKLENAAMDSKFSEFVLDELWTLFLEIESGLQPSNIVLSEIVTCELRKQHDRQRSRNEAETESTNRALDIVERDF